MQTLLIVLLIIVCISLIAVVLLQSGKSAGLSGAISGGAEQLFGKQKARGMDLVLHRGTVITTKNKAAVITVPLCNKSSRYGSCITQRNRYNCCFVFRFSIHQWIYFIIMYGIPYYITVIRVFHFCYR